jgi:NRPS condensation-like uncharacterized protein
MSKVNKIKLDPVGNLYSMMSGPKNPCTHGIRAHLKTQVDKDKLQRAAEELLRRLPHLNVRLKRGFFWFRHESMQKAFLVEHADNYASPEVAFKKGNNHLLRVLYKENTITLIVLHTLCDGRAGSKIMAQLLKLYFGLDAGEVTAEDSENAYERYVERKAKGELFPETKTLAVKAEPFKGNSAKVISATFELNELKERAKAYGLTITEFYLARIFYIIFENHSNKKLPINAMVPIDCRSFLPSETKRNFVTFKNITVKNGLNFDEIAKSVKEQFAKIDKNYVIGNISTIVRIFKLLSFVPLCLKSFGLKLISGAGMGFSTTFTNLGLLKVGAEVEKEVEYMEFLLGPDKGAWCEFSGIGIGNKVTLTANLKAEKEELVKKIFELN